MERRRTSSCRPLPPSLPAQAQARHPQRAGALVPRCAARRVRDWRPPRYEGGCVAPVHPPPRQRRRESNLVAALVLYRCCAPPLPLRRALARRRAPARVSAIAAACALHGGGTRAEHAEPARVPVEALKVRVRKRECVLLLSLVVVPPSIPRYASRARRCSRCALEAACVTSPRSAGGREPRCGAALAAEGRASASLVMTSPQHTRPGRTSVRVRSSRSSRHAAWRPGLARRSRPPSLARSPAGAPLSCRAGESRSLSGARRRPEEREAPISSGWGGLQDDCSLA